MLKESDLKSMPPKHEFAKGETEIQELHKDGPLRWVAIWGGIDWCIKVAPARYNFREVAEKGRIVDVPKYIYAILPCTDGAMALYRK